MRLFTSIISNLFGKFASFKFPSKLQHLINYSYCKLFNIDLSEFKD
ncbi:MAG: phosphatidylserine decarboxylase, partial [Epsilonproteobacteria bacterium]|nr:phosphatidylserine decarboxylase [Campylobacterota bacterium]